MLLRRIPNLKSNFVASFSACRHKSDLNEESSSQYCLNLVKKYDYEGFISALLVPDAPQRTTVIAVRAFNVEIALIAQKVSNAIISQGKLAFWQECLDKPSTPHHPVAQELHRARSRHKLSKAFLQRLVSSRRAQIDKPGHETLAELEQYAEDTVSPILYLALQSAGAKTIHEDHIGVAGHVGKAIGLTHALRGLSQARGASELAMPRAVLLKHKVSQEKLLRGRGSDKGVQDAVFEVASSAKSHLNQARATSVPKELIHFLLPSVPADIYLDRLEKTNFDPYHPSLQKRQLTLPFNMWLNKFRGKF